MLAPIGLAFPGRETPKPWAVHATTKASSQDTTATTMPEPPFFRYYPHLQPPADPRPMPAQTRNADPAGKIPFRTLLETIARHPNAGPIAQHHPAPAGPCMARRNSKLARVLRRGSSSSTTTSPNPPSLLPRRGPNSITSLEGRLACPDKRNSPFYRMPENLQGGLFTSGNIAFEKETFEQLGGFDEDLVVMEDLEIGHRIRTRGIPHTFCAGASAHHRAQKFGLGHLLWWSFHHRWGILYDYKTQAKPLSMPLPAAILHTLAKHILLLMRTTWHLFSQHDPNTWKNRWFWQIWGWVSLPLTLPCLISSEPKFRRMAQSSQKV